LRAPTPTAELHQDPPFPTTPYLSAHRAPYRPPFPHSLQCPPPLARRIPFHRHLPASLPEHPPAPKTLLLPSPAVHPRITALLLQFLSFLLSSFLRRCFPAAEPPAASASGSGPSFGGPWFGDILGFFCRFAPNLLSTFVLTVSTSGPAHASRNLLPPPNSVGTTSGDTHVGVEILAAHAR
jgi:hypothetical protein